MKYYRDKLFNNVWRLTPDEKLQTRIEGKWENALLQPNMPCGKPIDVILDFFQLVELSDEEAFLEIL